MSTRQSSMADRVSAARKADSITVASRARLSRLRTSAQKARLVVNEIRGKRVDEARAFLRNCRKRAAASVLKLLESAAENVRNDEKASAMFDLDELYVTRIEVGDGPSWKILQPAPMGRAYQLKKRTCHVTLELGSLTKAQPKPKGGKRAQGKKTTAAKPAAKAAAAR